MCPRLELCDNRYVANLDHPSPQVADVSDCPHRFKPGANVECLIAYGACLVKVLLLQISIGEQDYIEGSPAQITINHVE
jgi:hypothetical protein